MIDQNVGWGCAVEAFSWENSYGTWCTSSDDDLGCPSDPGDSGGGTDDQDDGTDCGPDVPGCGSPILLALDDGSYRLTSVSGGVRFDLRNDGTRPLVAWTRGGSGNAFLALDRNGNGKIDNGAELFGDYTPLSGGGVASNGFIALAELDDNHDGRIDTADRAWPVLLLWTDRDHDGVSSAGTRDRVPGSRKTRSVRQRLPLHGGVPFDRRGRGAPVGLLRRVPSH